MTQRITPNEYDLLIASTSWESRCTSFTDRILPTNSFKQAIVCRYPSKRETETAIAEDQHFRYIRAMLAQYRTPFEAINGQLWDADMAIAALDSTIRRLFVRPEGLRVLLDVSTMTKAYTLVFLRYLDEVSKRNAVSIFFTDLAMPQLGRPSLGMERLVALPLFGGHYVQGRETALFAFVGFEPDRLIGLWHKVEPNRTFPFYALRRDNANPLKLKLYREHFLNRPGVDPPIQISSDPFEVARTLAGVFLRHRDQFNICIAATGNKLQCVGTYLFTRLTSADAQIFYPVPDQYRWKYWNPRKIAPNSLLLDISDGYSMAHLPTELVEVG